MTSSMNQPFDLATEISPEAEYLACVAHVKKIFDRLDANQRASRARDIAATLGITEAQWVAASCDRLKSHPLTCKPQEIFARVQALGEVMALTRNQGCVHECIGTYENISADQQVLLIQGDNIDLRLFTHKLKTIWAVAENDRFSLQFFDQAGVAAHKIYCTESTDMHAYQRLVEDFALPILAWPHPVCQSAQSVADTVSQAQVLREAWLSLQDTHDFYGMLRRFRVTRVAAFKAVGTDLAQKINVQSIEQLLTDAAQQAVPIMCFVTNSAAIQIFTGTIHTLYRRGTWQNIIDPRFNLHLQEQEIASVWVVCKPTVDGWVTSVEVYDNKDELIVQFFGARKPGSPELNAWRKLLRQYCQNDLVTDSVIHECLSRGQAVN